MELDRLPFLAVKKIYEMNENEICTINRLECTIKICISVYLFHVSYMLFFKEFHKNVMLCDLSLGYSS